MRITLFILVFCTIALAPFPVGGAEPWWDTDWEHRKKITFDTTGWSSSLSSFPIRVYINGDTDIFAGAQADGDDIRFIDDDGSTQLAYEIEEWDSVDNRAEIWVKIPILEGAVTTDHIWIYYGNSVVGSGANPTQVWDSSFDGVWHLGEEGIGTRYDSTLNSKDGTPVNYVGTEACTGWINGADNFDGVNDYIDLVSSVNVSMPATISFWAKADTSASTLHILSGSTLEHRIAISATNFIYQYGTWGAGYYYTIPHNVTIQDTWHQFTFSFDFAYGDLYVDGAYAGNQSKNPNSINLNRIAGKQTGANWNNFDGILDEIRIESTSRPYDWVKASYEFQANPNAISVYGVEETVDTTAPLVSGAHLQVSATHAAGDGCATDGGITAGMTGLYIDYDSIIEDNPDYTRFRLYAYTAGTGPVMQTNDTNESNTTIPDPMLITGFTPHGAHSLYIWVYHYDLSSNQDQNLGGYYYVKPYTPDQPTVAQIPDNYTSLSVSVNPHSNEHAAVEHSIYCVTEGLYVAADGALGGGEVFQNASMWSTVTVSGLNQDTFYSFRSRSRNFYESTVISDNSSNAGATTDAPPPEISFLSCWDSFTKGTVYGNNTWHNTPGAYFEFGNDTQCDGFKFYWGTGSIGTPNNFLTYNPGIPGAAATRTATITTTWYFRVQAYRGTDYGPIETFVFKYETTPPTTTITFPADSSFVNSVPNMYGTAADSGRSGVEGVELSLFNNLNGFFFVPGTGFVASSPFWFDANFATPDWNFTMGDDFTSGGLYDLNARATDNAQNVGATVSNTFTFDDTPPGAPGECFCEGIMNPSNIGDTTPEFSAINTTEPILHSQFQVGDDSDWGNGAEMWDSGWVSTPTGFDQFTPDVSYAGAPLSDLTMYYWRIRFRDEAGNPGTWSSTQQFSTDFAPKAFSYISPTNGATGVPRYPNMRWGISSGADTYDVYLDTENPPLELVSNNQSGTTFDADDLDFYATYYWKVVAWNSYGNNEGPVWSFTAQGLQLNEVGFVDVQSDSLGVYVAGDYAYLVDFANGFWIADVSNPSSPSIVGQCETPGAAMRVYVAGTTACVADGTGGMQVIDVSSKTNPVIIGNYPAGDQILDVHINGFFVFATDYTAGIKAIDISNPASPSFGNAIGGFAGAYGLYVKDTYAYVADYTADFFRIVDISNPWGMTSISGAVTGTGPTNIFVVGSEAYISCVSSADLTIANISDPGSPAPVGSYGNGSGTCYDVFYTSGAAFIAYGTSGLIAIYVDDEDPSSPQYIGSCEFPAAEALGVFVNEQYIYVTDNNGRLHIVNMDETFTPQEAYDPQPDYGEKDVEPATTQLNWGACDSADVYDVYFGQNYPGTYVDTVPGTSYSPGMLSANTTYYWYIVPKVFDDEARHTVWYFKTGAPENIFVSNAGDNANDGMTWATAVRTIQRGLDLGGDGTSINLVDGAYTGSGNRDLDFNGKNMFLRSMNGPMNCIIDCQGLGRGFHFHSGENSSCLIGGILIQNGNAVGAYGGNIYCEQNSAPVFVNCIIAYGNATGGGGAGLETGSNAFFINCLFARNYATGWGGGILCADSNSLIINCTIADNEAANGGGVFCNIAALQIENSIIWFNNASGTGHQVYTLQSGDVVTCNASDIANGVGDIDGNGIVYSDAFCKTSDPIFEDHVNGEYSLLLGSPCVDAGRNLFIPAGLDTDLVGMPRIMSGTVDMGCIETDPLPTKPTDLETNQRINPESVGESEVPFTAIYHDEGIPYLANAMWLQFDNDSDFSSLIGDTGYMAIIIGPEQRSPAFDLDISSLPPAITFYWRVRFKNQIGEESPWSTETAYFIRAAYTVNLENAGWHLLEIPCFTGTQTVGELLGDDLGIIWIWRYSEAARNWLQVGANETFQNGVGYFVWCKYPGEVAGFNGTPVSGGTDPVLLSWTNTGSFGNDGWNLVRHPYPSALSWFGDTSLQNC
ncbi:MAG: DUF2341 domain-containing protein, partial [Planctomycetota bacterium]